MRDDTINILIGGEAGQGLVTVGLLLTRVLIRTGYHVCVTQDYMSRIRGGHNTFAVRTSTRKVRSPKEDIDILVALDQATVDIHRPQVNPDGVVVIDATVGADDASRIGVPYQSLASKRIMDNISALGVLAALLGLPMEPVESLVRETFIKKGDTIVDQNIKVLHDSHAWMLDQKNPFKGLPPKDASERRLMMNGNEAMVMGALAAGCNFCSFYPMTPATSIALGLIEKGTPLGFVCEQAEDEIAAINMALGASYAGARTIVPTSGGGFALMTEAVSLAGMLELPVVIALGMRPGPATGLPTRTEQGDLLFALHAGHGEFAKALYAPGSIGQCYRLAIEAFDVAERFQTPVIVMTDQFLADSYRDTVPLDLSAVPDIPPPLTSVDNPAEYKRFAITDSGVSPRAIPGFGDYLVVLDSDEHYEDGHITEDFGVRRAMVEKRLRKHEGIVQRVVPPDYTGEDNPDLLLACWGSSLGPVEEAASFLRREGTKVGVLHFSQVWPLRPDTFMDRLQSAREVACVEGNATGQFASLLRRETGFAAHRLVLRYDGLPFTPRHILSALGRA